MDKATQLRLKIAGVSNWPGSPLPPCHEIPFLELLYYLLEPKQRTWKTDFSNAQACVRHLQGEKLLLDKTLSGKVPEDLDFQGFYQAIIKTHLRFGPVKAERALVHVITSKPKLSQECFGYPPTLMPFIDPEKTSSLAEACANALVARVRGLPEKYTERLNSGQDQGSALILIKSVI
ncbi:hypothetical protein H0H93_001042 [Arthromyces matolae]|nr:hypothetical protein H0H93_001042 [Arthromyces matolae]